MYKVPRATGSAWLAGAWRHLPVTGRYPSKST